jgi:ubiquinone/menaquinone biosynthesis C-methylase UbiE
MTQNPSADVRLSTMRKYVHGYSAKESSRLSDQAGTLTKLLHADTHYPPGTRILEAGCGIGAQSLSLCRSSPESTFECMDISRASLVEARRLAVAQGVDNVSFRQGDIYALPYRTESLDHVFVCFVLEHLSNVEKALSEFKRVLKSGGTLTVIEGDHGSYYCHPKSLAADLVVQCLVKLQADAGGDALIGRRLYPLLAQAGYSNVVVSPRMVYVDASRPDLVEGFTRKTFTAMVKGVKDQALTFGLIDERTWDQGIADLNRTARRDGTFCYTFFKGVCVKP